MKLNTNENISKKLSNILKYILIIQLVVLMNILVNDMLIKLYCNTEIIDLLWWTGRIKWSKISITISRLENDVCAKCMCLEKFSFDLLCWRIIYQDTEDSVILTFLLFLESY